MAGNFTDSEKILYSLKYALLKATVDPENPDYLEPVAPPRVFPTNVMSQSLIENGVGDINSNGTYGGAASISGTVDLTKPWNIVKWYYIIDPTTNVITGNTVNDAITTQAVAETLPSGATSGSASSGSTSYTYYQEYFYGGNVPNATGVPSARTDDYKGLRLAYSKATVGTVCAEGNANLVPHISLYLQAPTSWVSPSGTKGDGDNWSYRNPHFRNLLGAEVGFEVSVNNYESGGKRAKIGYNTAGTATEFFWYTQASYGLLSFYGQTASGFGGNGQSNKPYLTFCRYIGESGTLGGGGGGGGGGATTLNALTDVTSSGATDGQALVWDNAASTWKPGSGGGGASTLNALTDVTSSGANNGQALVWDNGSSTWKPGTVAAAGGGGGGGTYDTISLDRKGQVLETLAGVCDGRSVTVESGTYTLSNVTAYQDTTGTWEDVPGSSISYKPPSGTKQVIFEFHISLSSHNAHGRCLLLFKLLIDGNSITSQNQEWQERQGVGGTMFYRGQIDITGTDDIANGNISSWSTNKTIKLQVVSYTASDYTGRLFVNYTGELPTNQGQTDTLIKPRMKIIAIGDESISVGVSALTKENSLTIPNFTGTYTTNKLYNQSDRLKFNGETILTSNNPTINLKGQVLETLAGELDGRTVTVASGTYTLGNVTERYDPPSPSSGYVAIPNCSINYKPPTGTKVLNYKIRIFAQQKDNIDCFIKFMLYVDGTPITASYEAFGTSQNNLQVQYITYSYQIQIGGTDDIPNGKFSSWNSNKLIEIRAMDPGNTTDTSWEMYLHSNWIPGPEPGDAVNIETINSIHRPKLEITAIGEGLVGVQKVVNVLGPGGIRNLSDIHMNIGNTVLSSNDAGGQYSGYAAFQTMQNYHSWESHWLTAQVYNATTGVYTGSKLTGTLAGEWLQIKFPQKVKIYKFGIQSGCDPQDNKRGIWNAPKAFVLFGSNDGTSFNNLGQFTVAHPKEYIHDLPSHYDEGARPYAGSRMIYRELSTPQTYQYFRLVVTQNMGNHTNYSDFTAGYGDGRTNITYLAYYGTLETDYANIGDLSDVSDSVSTAATGQTLIYNGSEWAPGAATASGSVVVSTAFDGGGALKLTEFTGTSTTSKLYNDKTSGENVLKFDGKTVLTGEGINRKGQILETLAGVCDGRSIAVASGTYTLENVSAIQIIASTTYIKANGSGISYKPPAGTKQVIISYATGIQARANGQHDPILAVVAKIGSSLTTNHFQSFRPQGNAGQYPDLYKDFTFIIDIGSVASDDIANGKLASWDVLKDIEINMKSYDTGNSSAIIHSAMHEGGDRFSYSGLFIPPRLTITAIGEGVVSIGRNITAVTRNLKRRISHPDDGHVLAYHTAGDEDTYQSVYPLENMFKYVGSSTGISNVGGHSDNEFTSANNWNWTTAKNPAFNATVAPGIIGPYVGAQFSEKFVFTSIRILPRVGNGYAHSCPRVFYIYGSNDRVNWDLIFSKSLPNITTSSPSQSVGPYTVGSYTTFEIPDNGVGYKNFHMIVTNTYTLSNATTANFNCIDLSIYGYEADITASIANLKDVDTISTQPEIGQGLVWNGNKWVPGKQVNEGVALDGQVLEVLAGVCDGRTIVGSSGSYILENVTAEQSMTAAWVKATGSEISYKPPSGTKVVKFTFRYAMRYWSNNIDVWHQVLYLDGTQVGSTEETVRPGSQGHFETMNQFVCILSIGGTNDVANGKLASWDTLKKIEVRMGNYESGRSTKLHVSNIQAFNDGTDLLTKPQIAIEAIGNKLYQPAQIVRTLEGSDGTKNISDLNMYHGYTISSSGYAASATDKRYRPEIAFFSEEGTGTGSWHTVNDAYSNGSYAGSVSTNGYNGEWIQINFGKKAKVYHYGIRPQQSNNADYEKRAPGAYKLFGSNDGSSWTDVHTGSATVTDYGPYGWVMNRNTLSTPVTYQYFRLVINSTAGTGVSYCTFSYLGFYGAFFDDVGISKKVSDLIDVDLTAPSDGEALIYDASISKWKPGGNAALNFAPNVVVCYNQDTSTVDGTDRWRRFGVAQGSTTGGLEVTITPTTLTSKIKLSMSLIHCNNENRTTWIVRIIRTINGVSRVVGSDNTDAVAAGTDWGSQFASFVLNKSDHTSHATSSAYDTIDEPQTLSPVTYHIQIASYPSSTRTLRFNRALGGTSLDATVNRSVLIAEEMMGSKALVSHNGYSFNMQPDLIYANRLDTDIAASNTSDLPGWQTPLNFPTDTITNTNTSVYSYDAGKITVLQDGYYKAIFRVGTSSNNTSGEDARLASASIGISTDGGVSYTTPTFNYAGGLGGSSDYDSACCNGIYKLNKNDIIIFHGRGNMWNDCVGFSVERLEGTQPLTQEGALVLPEFTGTDTTNRLYAENGLLKFNGKTVDNHSVKNRKGQVLENLTGVCDGRTIEVDSGTYTLENVTVKLQPNGSYGAAYGKATGSFINYKPPPGTKQVIYKYYVYFSFGDADAYGDMFSYKIKLDGQFIGDSNATYRGTGQYGHEEVCISYVIDIGGDDIEFGKIPSWNTNKSIEVWVRDYGTTHEVWLHRLYYLDGVGGDSFGIVKPRIEITAIGDAAIQNATAVTGQSSVYFSGWVDGDSSSQCGTVTLSDGTSSTFHAFHNYSYHTGYNVLQYNNIGGCMNNSNGEFTVPHTGLYQINANVVNSTTDKRALVYLHMSNPLKNYPGDANPDMSFLEVNNTGGTNPHNRAGVSHTYHFQAGEKFYFYQFDGTSGGVNDMWLTITALQDQVPQTITARPGMTLETLAGVCDGRSITVASGTYTLPNVTGEFLSTLHSWTDLTGSEINYKPPVGTKQVIYKLKALAGNFDSANSESVRFVIDGTPVTNQDFVFGTNGHYGQFEDMTFVIDITGTNDLQNGKLASWDSNKTLKIQVNNSYHSTHRCRWHASDYTYELTDGTFTDKSFVQPTLIIQAIGDGPGIRPASGGNIVHRSDTIYKNVTIASTSILDYEYQEMRMVITPSASDSVIELKYDIFGDFGENLCFRITRNINGTDVLVIPAPTYYEGAIACPTFDANEILSSPEKLCFSWYDEPNTTGEVTYKLWIGASHSTNRECFLNRSQQAPSNYNETGVSTSAAIEHNKHARPYDEDGALTIPTFTGSSTAGKLYNDGGTLKFDGRPLGHKVLGAKGQVLETLEGLCDGRSITVSSGKYTLPTAAFQTWSNSDHAMKDIDASIINYKPPVGTKQVIYEFRFIIWYNASTSGYQNGAYDFYIDGNKLGHTLAFQKGHWESNFDTIKLIVDIGENDYENNKILDWNSLKQIKIQMAEASNGSKGFVMHKGRYNNDDYFSAHMPETELLDHPTIKITAIGDGPSYSPATGSNIIPKTVSDPYVWTIPDGIPGLHISPMDITITPSATDSVIELKWNIFFDCMHDVLFRVTRNYNGADVLVLPADQKWKGGLGVVESSQGVVDVHSTPALINIRWYDEPNTLLPVTYKVWAGWSGGANTSEPRFNLNRPDASNDSNAFERGNSTVLAIEHAKRGNPLDAENALSIPEFAGSDPDNKLYNNGGVLHFNGNPVGSGGIMMQFEDTNLLSHQGSYTLKHNETNFCVANENAQLSTFRLTQIGSSGTGKYNVSVVVKNNNAGKLTAIKEQSSTVTVIPIENIYTNVRYQTEPTRDGLIDWFPCTIDNKDAISRTRCLEGGTIVDAINHFDSKFDGDKCYSAGIGHGNISSPPYEWSKMPRYTIMFWWKYDNITNDESNHFTLVKIGGGKYQSGHPGVEGMDRALDYGIWILSSYDGTTNFHDYYVHVAGAGAEYINNGQRICNSNEWNHFAFVHNSSTDYTMYFNGVPTPTKVTDPLTAPPDGIRNHWTGVYHQEHTLGTVNSIKDYRVYNRALSVGELAAFQTTIKDTNAGGVAVGNIKPPINLTKNELVSVEVRPIGGEHNKYTTKVNVDLMGNSGTVLDGTSKWDNDTQGISYSAGNVGIGILNPSEKLSISDNVRIDGVIKPNGISGTPGQSLSLSDDGLSMEWKNVGVSGLTSLNGNIGIGTTSPYYKLEVNGSSWLGSDTKLLSTALLSWANAGNNTASTEHYFSAIKGDATNKYLSYFTNNNERMRIISSGNVGIGTTSPLSKLNIAEEGNCVLTIENTTGTMAAGRWIGQIQWRGQWIAGNTTSKLEMGAIKVKAVGSGGSTGSAMTFHNSNGQERVRIDENGNVGIGTTDPEAPFHVKSVDHNIRITQKTSSQYPNHQTNIIHGGQHYDCYDIASEKVAGATGNGQILYLNYYSGAGVKIASGTSVTSDDRLKHNEKKIENALDIINKITAKKYFKSQKRYDEDHNYELDNSGNPITEDDYKIETGIIAQEVMTVPELKYLVDYTEDKNGIIDDYEKDNSGNFVLDASGEKIKIGEHEEATVRGRYSIRYNDLFCYNIAATQELDRKVAKLEAENAELKAELAAIKAHLGL